MEDQDTDPRLRGRPITPAELKALAHPLRIQLLELLMDEGPSTASHLGRTVGESSGTTSYHLRRLAAAGLITEASDVGTGRDRYWRAVSGWSLESDLIQGRDTRRDARIVLDEVVRTNIRRMQTWYRDSETWPDEWREASIGATTRLVLTPAQLRELGDELLLLIDRYRQAQHSTGTVGTAKVVVQADIFPTGQPEDVPG